MSLYLYIVFHSDGTDLVAARNHEDAIHVAGVKPDSCTVRYVGDLAALAAEENPAVISSCIQN